MKEIIGLFTLVCVLMTPVAEAQETPPQSSVQTAAPPQTTGEATVEAATTATDNDWENWVFASCALAVVIAGVAIVSFNQGHTLNDH